MIKNARHSDHIHKFQGTCHLNKTHPTKTSCLSLTLSFAAMASDEDLGSKEERMEWLRARGVRIEEPTGGYGGPAVSGSGRSFIYVSRRFW